MKQALTILAVVMLTACGESGTDTPPKPLWNTQLEQLNKAKQVDTMVQQQADEQRRQLELQTQ